MSSLQIKIRRSSAIAVISAVTLALAGCATFRPMPTHGGGKRFDEEQRLVSATIQHAADKMNFAQLRKSRVAIEVTSIPTSGNSREFSYDQTNYGGLKSVYGYHLQPRLDANKNITRQDIEYLEKELVRRLRYDGYQVTAPKDADIYLVVLVDSLGTNHIRRDLGILFRDSLAVSCEMTYYAIDAKTQKMITTARSVASIGDYRELNVRFTPISFNSRSLTDFDETIVPLPQSRYCATGAYGLAHVDDLQFKPKQGKPGRGGGGGGRAPKFNLPGDRMQHGPDGELLPRLPDDGATPQEKMAKLIKQGYGAAKNKDAALLASIIEAMRKLKPDAPVIKKLEERLEQLRKEAPQAPVPVPAPVPEGGAEAPMNRQEKMKILIKQGYAAARAKDAVALQKTIDQIRELKADANVIGKLEIKLKELKGGGGELQDGLPLNYLDASYTKFNWWREPEFVELPDYYWHEDIGWPIAQQVSEPAKNVPVTIGYLDLPRW